MRITYIAIDRPGHGRHTVVDSPLAFKSFTDLNYTRTGEVRCSQPKTVSDLTDTTHVPKYRKLKLRRDDDGDELDGSGSFNDNPRYLGGERTDGFISMSYRTLLMHMTHMTHMSRMQWAFDYAKELYPKLGRLSGILHTRVKSIDVLEHDSKLIPGWSWFLAEGYTLKQMAGEVEELRRKFSDIRYFFYRPGLVKDPKRDVKKVGCVMMTEGRINNHPYDVYVVLSKTEIRKLAENFLEQEDLAGIFKKKCGGMTLKELMK